MDKLKEMLTMDPCYEQHIVSIKEIYEDHLYSILIPAIYEGLQSIYKRAFETEQKFIAVAKRNPDVQVHNVLEIYQTLLREIPNLNTHKIRNETDRIKASTKSAEVFDDLVRAVTKANIILLTYNIDHKRKDLLQTKYHENIIVHDFIHSCYIYAARNFHGCPELFYHKLENIVINQNKRVCFRIIKDSIREAIRMMLPMKEILLEYITQEYKQKDTSINAHLHNGMNGRQINVPGITQEEFIDVNNMVNRDLHNIGETGSLLMEEGDHGNSFEAVGGNNQNKEYVNDFSLLVSNSEHGDNEDTARDSLLYDDRHRSSDNGYDDGYITDKTDHNNSTEQHDKDHERQHDKDHERQHDKDHDKDIQKAGSDKASVKSISEHSTKMIDISGSLERRGHAQTFFRDEMPNIQQRYKEYKDKRKESRKDKDDNNIEIRRVHSTENAESEISERDDKHLKEHKAVSSDKVKTHEDSKKAKDIVNEILK